MYYKGEKKKGNLENTIIARLKSGTNNFEILVYPFQAWDFRLEKPDLNVQDVLAYEEIYSDLQQANIASKELLLTVFETTDIHKISEKIIKEGDLQFTTAQKQMMSEKREKEIISYITKYAHDPRNNTPIPEQRIVNAFSELNIKINLNKSKEKEIQDILDKLKRIMPISFEKITLTIEIPSTYTGKASGVIFKQEVVSQQWLPSGSLVVTLKIPAGFKNTFISDLNNITQGNIVVSSTS